MTKDQQNFINNIYNALLKYAPSYNIKCYPAIIGQAILESGWGKSSLAKTYHNYFGMKCGSSWKGKSVNLATKEEFTVGTLTSIRDNFRVYDSLEDGVRGYLEFLNYSRYKNLKGVEDTKTYLELIKQDGYATSSTYVTNVLNVVEQYGLEMYSFVEKNVNTIPEYIKYKVEKGDTLWDIACKYLSDGRRYKEIVELNHLKTTTIYPNQQLKIPM